MDVSASPRPHPSLPPEYRRKGPEAPPLLYKERGAGTAHCAAVTRGAQFGRPLARRMPPDRADSRSNGPHTRTATGNEFIAMPNPANLCQLAPCRGVQPSPFGTAMTGDPPILDYAPRSDPPRGWRIVTLLVAIGGPVLSFSLAGTLSSFVPMLLISAAALAFAYLAQKRMVRGDGSTRWDPVCGVGVILIFCWAPLFLVWSLIFIVSPY